MFGILRKLFGSAQERKLRKHRKLVQQVRSCEKMIEEEAVSEEYFPRATETLKQRFIEGENLDDLLPEAYALVCRACFFLKGKTIDILGQEEIWQAVPYDEQILGAIAMHRGAIAQMQTGEGKTLTATLPLYLHALSAQSVHLVTVNDYLAQRDCAWMGSIFLLLGLRVGALTQAVAPEDRKELYDCDVLYVTASELGFDYLRDHSSALSSEQQVQKKAYFAIVDEIDSILIDEARTPLIISGPVDEKRQMYDELKGAVLALVNQQKQLCDRLAEKAQKEITKDMQKASEQLWLISHAMPRHPFLRSCLENPSIRGSIDSWDLHYHKEQYQEDRLQLIAQLYIVLDEKGRDYELTDLGIQSWSSLYPEAVDDFTLLDLGHEYALVEGDNSLSQEEKVERKERLCSKDLEIKERLHTLRQLLRAHLLMEKDVDYMVHEDRIVIIDENTGRPQPGRRFSDGLHQSIEAKEGLAVQKETQTYATITLQNYFRMYERLSGMTGTAMTEAAEFREIYGLDVVEIPTHKPCARELWSDQIYMTEREKNKAILKSVQELRLQGRPILLGTESLDVSERLSNVFLKEGISHTVLNARQSQKEAEIIALAGKKGSITIATNMAGRGTDIRLDVGVRELGGLHVLGCSRHQSRRIDRQLLGRCARQGDPGSSQFFVSFEDSLMRLFASSRVSKLLQRFRPPEGEAIAASILDRAIEGAQKRVEQRNYTARKYTLQYDDVMNVQRKEVYAFRDEILHIESVLTLIEALLSHFVEDLSLAHKEGEALRQELTARVPIALEKEDLDREPQETLSFLQAAIQAAFLDKLNFEESKLIIPQEQKKALIHSMLRRILCSSLDHLWQEHLLRMDHLKAEVHLQSLAQKDPLIEFKHAAFASFGDFSERVRSTMVRELFHFSINADWLNAEKLLSLIEAPSEAPVDKKDRNANCPCGSGKKYKKCCL